MAILLQQAPETAIAHLAAFKAGLISVPLFTLFGEDALRFRLFDSGARGIVTDAAGAEKLLAIRHFLPGLEQIFVVGPDFDGLLAKASDRFVPVDTGPDDPALLV